MDKPISVGDLVVIVRSVAGNEGAFGTVMEFMGTTPVTYRGGLWYGLSGESGLPCWLVSWENKRASRLGNTVMESPHPGPWLKRIPPLSELGGEKRDEKLTEPA